MNIAESLIEKYNVPVPRYTSYPPANFFTDQFGEADYRAAIEASNQTAPQNISLYLHIPFCSQLCLYCGCNTHITRNEALKAEYVASLKAEIALLAPLLQRNRKVTQLHWGGGTPNSLSMNQVSEIMECLHRHFSFDRHAEIAMECHPAHIGLEGIDQLLQLGFNRISIGVQDFRPEVLQTVHREAPVLPVETLVAHLRHSGKATVNLDFIYGLPGQTQESFAETMEQAIAIRPDRLVTFSYAHIPTIKKSQRLLEKAGLVPAGEKLAMFLNSYGRLKEAGYVPIGLDHFALPHDELAMALQQRTLHRNFQGYCTRETTGQVYALGTTGISQLTGAFAQHTAQLDHYNQSITSGHFPTVKGYHLSKHEQVIGQAIASLMCNQYLHWDSLGDGFGFTGTEALAMLRWNSSEMDALAADGLINYSLEWLEVTETGRFFVRNIVAALDPGSGREGKTFSKAL